MTRHHLPTIEALTDDDDERLRVELRLGEVRDKLALACELIERIDEAPPSSRSRATFTRRAMASELAHLGYRVVEIARDLAETRPASTLGAEAERKSLAT